jgi:hypothetical protein
MTSRFMVKRRPTRVATWFAPPRFIRSYKKVEDTEKLPARTKSVRLLRVASVSEDPADQIDAEDERKV